MSKIIIRLFDKKQVFGNKMEEKDQSIVLYQEQQKIVLPKSDIIQTEFII